VSAIASSARDAAAPLCAPVAVVAPDCDVVDVDGDAVAPAGEVVDVD
jgi:hypothetical protein